MARAEGQICRSAPCGKRQNPRLFTAADIALGAASLTLGVAALIGYAAAGDGALRVMLWPHAKITEAFYHITLHYQNGAGYVAPGGAFAIGQGCMGMNFIVMLFCLVVCVFTRRFAGFRKIPFFALAMAGSVAVGILTSCIRIIGSVPLLSSSQFTALHSGTGAALYLACLVGSYLLLKKATGGTHEKHQ